MTRNAIHVRSGFTLMELMVAVSLLVLVILGVGMIFQNTSKAVGLSQATTDTFAGVRALSRQIEKDVSSLDTNGFLVIRSRNDTVDTTRRFDQISFLAKGSFRNMTGTVQSTGMFTDRTMGNAAHIWYGQLVMAADGGNAVFQNGTTYAYANENTSVPLNSLPTGMKNQDFVLGRHITLLLPDDGSTAGTNSTVTSSTGLAIPAFRRDPTYAISRTALIPTTGEPSKVLPDTAKTVMTSSRVGAAGYTTEYLMNLIRIQANPRSSNQRLEADNFCYRFRALPSIWDSGASSDQYKAINGYFRMTPIMLSGVPSFRVDWTDGATNSDGSLKWYGYASDGVVNYNVSASNAEPSAGSSGDGYTAQFSFDNKTYWPKALRFTYRVTDPNDRLAGGRTFTQIVALPK